MGVACTCVNNTWQLSFVQLQGLEGTPTQSERDMIDSAEPSTGTGEDVAQGQAAEEEGGRKNLYIRTTACHHDTQLPALIHSSDPCRTVFSGWLCKAFGNGST